ncbi:MAG: hypothetical protein KGH66_01865 [Candidatus Micrarchaeota archaeon]|nr:hypothetical protein [Candidatus Micrarchaeota archaeon]
MGTTLVYSTADSISLGGASELKGIAGFEEAGELRGHRLFKNNDASLLEVDVPLFRADMIDKIVDGTIIFLSQHKSSGGVGSFTAHSTGNWSSSAELGGEPLSLSTAAPAAMLSMLKSLGAVAPESTTYEATHHGPLAEHPSFFVEMGGNPDFAASEANRRLLATAVADAMDSGLDAEYGKVAIGIGGTHYPQKFTRLALEGRYAFGHIMPAYALNVEMIAQAVERSGEAVETAVIEWKSIKAPDRERVIKRLDELGMDHERV